MFGMNSHSYGVVRQSSTYEIYNFQELLEKLRMTVGVYGFVRKKMSLKNLTSIVHCYCLMYTHAPIDLRPHFYFMLFFLCSQIFFLFSCNTKQQRTPLSKCSNKQGFLFKVSIMPNNLLKCHLSHTDHLQADSQSDYVLDESKIASI